MKPLIPLVGDPDRYYILALDLNNSALYEASRFSIRKLEMEDTPTSMEEALQYDEFERYLQFHTRAPAGASGRQALFHGQGVGTDDAQKKKYILQFFHQLDRGVVGQLTGEEAPLVTIGVDYLTSIYKEANGYPRLMQEGIHKDPHSLSEQQLQELGLQVVEPLMEQQKKNVVEKFNNLKSDGKASSNVEEIIPAAHQGRIETLFVDRYKNAWGLFDPMKQQAVFHEEKKFGDRDLLDFAALNTLLKEGAVYVLEEKEMPAEEPLAAIFRY
jgi:hypothetical protein